MKRFILFFLFFIIFFIGSITVFANQKEDYQSLVNEACDNIYDDKYNEALKKINKAVKINPDLPEAYFTRAGLHLIEGRYKDAVKDYEKVIVLTNGNARDAEFFREIAQNAVLHPHSVSFYKYNVVYRLGEGVVVPRNKEEEELVEKIVYAKTLIEGHSESLKNYCSSTGVLPEKYFNLNSETFKKTKANLDNIINKLDEKTESWVEIYYNYKVKKYDDIHDYDFAEMKKDMIKNNQTFTKADYCKSFDKDAEFFINNKREKIKNGVPDLFVD